MIIDPDLDSFLASLKGSPDKTSDSEEQDREDSEDSRPLHYSKDAKGISVRFFDVTQPHN